MQLSPAIECHRKPLLRIIATLFAMIGLAEGTAAERVQPSLYRKVLRILRPAESAVRRLIVAASRSITLKPSQQRPTVRKPAIARKPRPRITFRLFDPRARFSSTFAWDQARGRIKVTPVKRLEPRIRILDVGFDPRIPLFRQPPPPPQEPLHSSLPDGTVSALRISRRLLAIKSALEDLPRQARRYLRWQSKPQGARRPQFVSALRPGTPPGFRKNPIHKVDEILAECDWLARHPPQPDSS